MVQREVRYRGRLGCHGRSQRRRRWRPRPALSIALYDGWPLWPPPPLCPQLKSDHCQIRMFELFAKVNPLELFRSNSPTPFTAEPAVNSRLRFKGSLSLQVHRVTFLPPRLPAGAKKAAAVAQKAKALSKKGASERTKGGGGGGDGGQAGS